MPTSRRWLPGYGRCLGSPQPKPTSGAPPSSHTQHSAGIAASGPKLAPLSPAVNQPAPAGRKVTRPGGHLRTSAARLRQRTGHGRAAMRHGRSAALTLPSLLVLRIKSILEIVTTACTARAVYLEPMLLSLVVSLVVGRRGSRHASRSPRKSPRKDCAPRATPNALRAHEASTRATQERGRERQGMGGRDTRRHEKPKKI